MNVAIIPARGGSKRIPNKNIKLFEGKPVIYYSINAARESAVFDRIVVSTDSEVIAETAQAYGAEVPFVRPQELSDDKMSTVPVLVHAIRALSEGGNAPQYVCCIYATAPFVRPEYIRQGYEIITTQKVSSVFSITTFPFPIFRALRQMEDGHVEMFWPEHEMSRSQDLPIAYHDAGQFYWLDSEVFLEKQKIYSQDALPVILPRHLVQDIDTYEDWEAAERMFQAIGLK